MGRGRASPCWALSRAGPVLVPRAEIAAQARPGLWHGHDTGPRGNRPGRVSAVLYRTGPVPACWARPIWPTLLKPVPASKESNWELDSCCSIYNSTWPRCFFLQAESKSWGQSDHILDARFLLAHQKSTRQNLSGIKDDIHRSSNPSHGLGATSFLLLL